MRNGGGDMFGMLALDRFVMVAVHDQDRQLDRSELCVRPVRLICPHPADLIDECPVLPGRRVGGVFAAGALDERGKRRVPLDILLDARRRRVGGEREHAADPPRMAHRQVEADDAAIAPSDDVRAGQLQHVHQRHDVVRHQVIPIRPCIAGAAAMATAVHHDDQVMGCECRYLPAPIVRIRQSAMQQDHRRAMSVDRVVDTDAVGIGKTAAGAGDRRGRWRQRLPALHRPAFHRGARYREQ